MKIKVFLYTFFIFTLWVSCRSENKEDYYYPVKKANSTDTTSGVVIITCDTSKVTFSGSVQPIVKENCLKCHYKGNGSRPELHDYENFKMAAEFASLVGHISHTQEPFMPKDAPKLSDCKINTIRIWVNNGMKND